VRTTENEKKLLFVLTAIVVGSGCVYGYKWITQQQTVQQATLSELQADQAAAQVDLQDSDLYAKRKAWIDANEPMLTDEGTAKAQLQAYIQKGARDHKLEIIEQNLNDSEPGPAGLRINASVKVKGPMEGLAEWLTEFQKPDQFYAVTSCTLNADPDMKSMICTLQLARFYKGGK
jgi:hypothetical protein